MFFTRHSIICRLQFLAPEKLRGVGGILLNAEGRRFVDELTTRDKAAQVGWAQSKGLCNMACCIGLSAWCEYANQATSLGQDN